MRQILNARNLALLHDIDELARALAAATIPRELDSYKERILSVCNELRSAAHRNLTDIALGREEILEDVLSNTQQVMQYVRLLSSRMVTPILRASSTDRLSLSTINWLHGEHSVTASISAAFADGDCSIWPFVHIAPIYFFPCLEQRELLYQPLYFHEFGHLLYVCHKEEMDDLIRELQRKVQDILVPVSHRNDRHADAQATRRQIIIDTWYRWSQELFCDAVGLTIGGPSFILAFSGYLGTMQRGDFYRQPADLEHSEHPVTWLRVQLLAKRARAVGFIEPAMQVENEWRVVARAMGVPEDYHGYYEGALEAAVMQTVDDMLTEAGPRRCTESEARGIGWDSGSNVLLPMLNHAWEVYGTDPDQYAGWEADALCRLLG